MEYKGTPLKEFVELIIGEWSIRMTEEGQIIGGIAGLDYAYLVACVILLIGFAGVLFGTLYVLKVFVTEFFYTLKSWR